MNSKQLSWLTKAKIPTPLSFVHALNVSVISDNPDKKYVILHEKRRLPLPTLDKLTRAFKGSLKQSTLIICA